MSDQVSAMFSHIASVYDLLNHTLSFGVDRSWRAKLAELAPRDSPILDLAAGTLDVALALHKARPDAMIIAADFCAPMLKHGLTKLNSPELKTAISPCAADALNLPLSDASVACITMAFGIRNIKLRSQAFQEMFRALKPGGRAFILEFGSASERIWGGLYNIYLQTLLPLVGRLIARDKEAYAYLARTIREFPPATELAREMADVGFVNVGFQKLTGGIVCIHWCEKPIEDTAASEQR